MCKKGDIIVIDSYKDHSKVLSKHSFVVLDDDGGQIHGFAFDFIALVMSSVKSWEHLKRKLRYDGNLPISSKEQVIINPPGGNKRDSYLKCDQFYYFVKDKIKYARIGYLRSEIFDIVLEYVNELIENGIEIEDITDNIK